MSHHWVEPLLYVAASAVGAIYVFQTLWPKIRQVLRAEPTAEERTAAILRKYRQAKDDAEP